MTEQIKVLLVEDDPNLGTLLFEYLKVKGYAVEHATDGEEGLKAFNAGKFDFIILDVMMPKMDGFLLAENIRKKNDTVPLLFLTAKTMPEDRLQGFKLGADDYMTKPFSMEELLARMQAILKRSGWSSKDQFEETHALGGFTFNPKKQVLAINGEEIKLTTKENQLLKMLSANRNEVLARQDALTQVWGDDTYHNGRSMDVYITKLRKHLRADPSLEIINVHGEGFRLLVQEER
jgi:DNA-binding response OmpR family regulator